MEYKLTFEAYNEALKNNELLGLKCKECGTVTVPPKMACRKCASKDMEVVKLKGNGEIKTFTTVRVAPEGREGEVPYTIVLVELEEGAWLMGNLVGIDHEKTSMELIGKKVEMKTQVFDGDRYSAGDAARPVFSIKG